MQHLQNQRPAQQNRSIKIHQRWNIISEAIQMEENQRSSYVMDNLKDLENSIIKEGMIISSKQKLTSDELQNQKNKCHMINVLALSGPQKEEQARSALENRTDDFVNTYQQKADGFNREASQNKNRRINEVCKKFEKQHANIVKRTSDNTKQIMSEAQQIKNIIFNQRQKTNQEISNLKQTIDDQTSKIQTCIIQMKSVRLQNDRKLEAMIQDLDLLLYGIVDQQFKAGQIAYDCLLKLFEDTCSKMENKLIK